MMLGAKQSFCNFDGEWWEAGHKLSQSPESINLLNILWNNLCLDFLSCEMINCS